MTKRTSHFRTARRTVGALLIATIPLGAQTYGSALVERPNTEDRTNFITVPTLTLFQSASIGRLLSSFSVFGGGGDQNGNLGRNIRPLLLSRFDDILTIEGVGANRVVADGINTWDFGLTGGSAMITANSLFGWWSGGGGGGGAVQFSNGGSVFLRSGESIPSPTAGARVTTPSTGARMYSIQWTVGQPSTTAPEPSTYALVTAGLAAVFVVRRRRRRAV